MDAFRIHGGQRLTGTVSVDGSKNAALPLLAAALLTEESVSFTSVPKLSDIENMLRLLNELGCSKKYSKDTQTSQIGGDLGWINPQTYPIKEIGLALPIIKSSECSLPINTSFGFHLLWLEKIRPGGRPNLNDHWPKIEELTLNNKKMNWYENWIKNEKRKFYIEIVN